MSLLRVLICDFDFFSTVGGGQVFYRRVIERNPDLTFFYPSRARDFELKAEGRLPGNAHPFLIGATAIDEKLSALGRSVHPVARVYVDSLAAVAASVQGEAFDVVDIPSFFPAAHLVRPVFACFGITAVRVVLSMLGWNSVSCRSSYQDISQIAADLEIEEIACANAADVRYTISPLEQRLHTRGTLPVQQVDMHDFLEEFPLPDALPPGSGPPDLWYVGRLDGAKGPDIFVDLAARLPRCLYRRCYLTGPDNLGHAEARWSAHVLNLARRHGVDASYLGLLSDADVRRGAYQGRSVVVVPSRSDSFNFVALEAVLSGCPVLLSSRTGASEFLAKQHPTLVPPIMNPDDLDDAARRLRGLLEEYQGEASRLRQALRSNPFPPPRINGMAEIYGLAVSARQPAQTRSVVLVIGMAESIHVARWMSMVALSPALKFVLCPVFRPGVEKNRINPDFRATRIVRSAEEIADILPGEIGLFDVDSVAPDDLTAARRATGFKPYHPSFLPSKWKFTEPGHIAAAITRLRPALVISLEVQFAGYLAIAAKDYLGAGFPRWLLSNWGSDIYLYSKL